MREPRDTALALAVLAVAACHPPPAPDPTAAAFGAELQACVARASTREESRACRDEVERRWAPVLAARKDGGQ